MKSGENKEKKFAGTENSILEKSIQIYSRKENAIGSRPGCILDFKYSTVIVVLLLCVWSLGDKLLQEITTKC